MKKWFLIWILGHTLAAGMAAAFIIPPTRVEGKSGIDGATTDPRVVCHAALLSHGYVECQLTLKEPLLEVDRVMIHLRDGTEKVILSAELKGAAAKDRKSSVYRITIDRLTIRNSYVQITTGTGKGENLWLLLDSVEILDDWTHKQDLSGWSEEQVLGTFGTPEYDSRKSEGGNKDAPYVLTWRYGRGRDISVRIKDAKVIDQWRGSQSRERTVAEPPAGGDGKPAPQP